MDLNLGLAPAIAFWLASAFFSRFVARTKNRSGDEWFVLGLVFPVLALLAVGLAEKQEEVEEGSP